MTKQGDNIRQTKKQRILESASHIFAENDYADVSLRLIANYAKVARGTLYNNFGNKEQLYSEVLGLRLGQLMSRLKRVVNSEDDPSVNLRRCVVQPFLFFVKYQNMLLLWRREDLRKSAVAPNQALTRSFVDVQVLDMRTQLLTVISGVVAAGVRKDIFRKVDAMATAHTILGAVESSACALYGNSVRCVKVKRAKEELHKLISEGLYAVDNKRQLRGAKILLTRPTKDCEDLATQIARLYGKVTIAPMIKIQSSINTHKLAEIQKKLGTFDLIVITSRHAAKVLIHLTTPKLFAPQIAAVGPSSARAVEKMGWPVAYVSSGKGVSALCDELEQKDQFEGKRLLYVCSNLASDYFKTRALQAKASYVEMIAVYRVDPPQKTNSDPLIKENDILVFASPSAAANLVSLSSKKLNCLKNKRCVAIGATTYAELEKQGATNIVKADSPDTQGLTAAILQAWDQTQLGKEE